MCNGRDHRAAAHRPAAQAPSDGAGSLSHTAALSEAVRAAPRLRQPDQWRLRVLGDRTELHAAPSTQPTVDPTGRGRAIAGGAALRNLELTVANLGHRPVVRLLPDAGDPQHLATVTTGEDRQPEPAERRLHGAMPQRRCHSLPFEPRPVPPWLSVRLHDAVRRPGVRAAPMAGEQLRTVGTVLAAAVSQRHPGEDHLADVESWLAVRPPPRTPGTERTMVIDQLGRGALMLVSTESDDAPDWIMAGWAVQNAWLTAIDDGLVASVLGGVLDAPGVRSALACRLRLNGCPQLLLRVGWAGRGATTAIRAGC